MNRITCRSFTEFWNNIVALHCEEEGLPYEVTIVFSRERETVIIIQSAQQLRLLVDLAEALGALYLDEMSVELAAVRAAYNAAMSKLGPIADAVASFPRDRVGFEEQFEDVISDAVKKAVRKMGHK